MVTSPTAAVVPSAFDDSPGQVGLGRNRIDTPKVSPIFMPRSNQVPGAVLE